MIALFMGIASTSLSDPAVVNALISELESSSTSSAFDGSSSYSSYDYSGMTQDEAMAVASASIFLMVGLSLGYVLCKVVCLVAGIIALRNCNNPLNWAVLRLVYRRCYCEFFGRRHDLYGAVHRFGGVR